MVKSLPQVQAEEILDLWEEYAQGETTEAQFARALDKTEVLLQHNEADIKFLTKKEYPFNFIHGLEHAEHDAFLKEFRRLINKETLGHYKKNKVPKELYET